MRPEDYPYKAGDIVKCNYDFIEERKLYALPYPKRGDYLKVVQCFQHEEEEDVFMIYFEHPRLSIPLSSERFDIVQTEIEGDGILNEAYKIANNL